MVKKDMDSLSNRNCTIHELPDRQYAAWIGGSKLSHLPTFDQMLISLSEYDDTGVQIVHQKSFYKN